MLDDLNIVAIPAQPKLQQIITKRTKKNNKYERRRQRAKRARQQPPHDSILQSSSPSNKFPTVNYIHEKCDSSSSGSSPSKSASTTTTPDELNATTRPENVIEKSSTTEREDEEIPFNNDKSSVVPVKKDSQKGTQKENKVEKDNSSSLCRSKQRQHQHRHKEEDNGSPLSMDKLSSKPVDDGEEHAKYMAEFHARPLELDRRSGARASTKIVSRESTHIFDDTQNDWDTLGIHPRLVQTLTETQHGFNMKQPTTIQSRTIQSFQFNNGQQDQKQGGDVNKKNILVHSETGSGKTLAYIIPILQSLAFGNVANSTDNLVEMKRTSRSEMGCRCIILCPTRELANQTLDVVERLCQANFAGWIVPGGLLGGDSRHSEKSRLRKGLAIVVATPGRLLDHLHKTQSLALSLKGKLQWLVLDEADRLLDMGLGDQVRQIVQWIRANEASKQQPWWRSVLVSATVTPSVQALAKEKILCGNQDWIWVKGDNGSKAGKIESPNQDAVKMKSSTIDSEGTTKNSASSENYSNSTPRQLAQFHITVTAKLRLSTLVAFLVQRISKGERTVVFMGTCASVDYHFQLFNTIKESLWDGSSEESDDPSRATKDSTGLFGKKASVFKLHGNVAHAKRNQTMKEFGATALDTKNNAAILLTTDVAARGLNLEGIDWTVQYDPPCEITDYVHRVGRVARAGKAGHSLLFLLPSERTYLEVLETKGIINLNPLSLSTLLNQAAGVCTEWTRAGVEQGGGGNGIKKSQSSSGLKSNRYGEFFSAEVQRRLEECVIEDDNQARTAWKEKQNEQRKRKQKGSSKESQKEGQLLALAREAFLSFLRAYPTKKEPVVRSIFSSRALHFGHVAKSFALREPPKAVASKNRSKKQQFEDEIQDKQSNLPRSLEFGQTPGELHSILEHVEKNASRILEDDSDDDNFKWKKRQKVQNGKAMSAKALLLANAAKMQSNLMDAM